MEYYPIMIPTLNRYEHFKQCVESLSKNTHADKTELIIGLDYPPSEKYVDGYKRIKDYIPTISGFKKVTVFERNENYGPVKNLTDIATYAKSKYGAYIYTDDDNLFSPCFLDYINKALDYYWDNPKIISVSGYINKQFYGKINTPLLLNYDNNGWGAAEWCHKDLGKIVFDKNYYVGIIKSFSKSWRVLKACPAVFFMLLNMVKGNHVWGDVSLTVSNIQNDTYQLRPSFSLVRNTGYDGSGVHCGEDMMGRNEQEISSEMLYDYDFSDVTPVTDPIVKKLLYNHELPQGTFKKIKFFIKLILRYIKLYLELFFYHKYSLLSR